MTATKDWTSTTPETFRKAVAAWSWARAYYRMPQCARPPFGMAKLSLLLPRQWLVQGPGGVVGFVLGQAKWAGILLTVDRVHNDDARYYKIGHKASFVHVTYANQWTAFQYTSCSPLFMPSRQPGISRNKIVVMSGPGMGLLKARLYTQESVKSLSFEDLQFLCDSFGIEDNRSRRVCLEGLARKACDGEPEDGITAFVEKV